jgi:hypothetical protein
MERYVPSVGGHEVFGKDEFSATAVPASARPDGTPQFGAAANGAREGVYYLYLGFM